MLYVKITKIQLTIDALQFFSGRYADCYISDIAILAKGFFRLRILDNLQNAILYLDLRRKRLNSFVSCG